MSWTRFMDMHSGGRLKEKQQYIYIEAPEEEATVIFYNRFGHNPHRVTCTCCGNDYSIGEYKNFLEASGFDRGCRLIENKKENDGGHYVNKPALKTDLLGSFNHYQTIKGFEARKDVLIIRKKDIKANERKGEVPEQGYVWVG